MNDNGHTRLDLLLFSVSGIQFGVDAEQIAGMAAYTGEQADDLFWFHKELEYGDASTTYLSPTVLTIKTGAGRPYRVIIDAMADIAECSQTDIRLFPAHLESVAARKGMWGILLRQGGMVLLMDFQLLLKHNQLNSGGNR